ncbi:twin-arginine translocase subunit TatC [Haloarchaeobius iranensis]|uniref:Sec-independent protein translocase protein TatC n=1 Tax=Haloarchaeobius iranensis TaxID=996166 RepID=A0A1G9S8Z3_9EURY|nr:twin-arginine translocase subunit TatC [Haloarchaeobius iranensis]SDM31841.1 sec-independent protein translocase protein TatC [Haloarchaeobius iranensis]
MPEDSDDTGLSKDDEQPPREPDLPGGDSTGDPVADDSAESVEEAAARSLSDATDDPDSGGDEPEVSDEEAAARAVADAADDTADVPVESPATGDDIHMGPHDPAPAGDGSAGDVEGPRRADTDDGPIADADGGEEVPVGHAAGATRPSEAIGGESVPAGEPSDPFDEDDEEFEGPPDDEELPLAVHIEEMVRRLGIVLLAAAAASALGIPASEQIITTMWYDLLPATTEITRPHVYSPLEFILTKIKVASLAGILVALPLFVYESYLFMRPGLYPKERRYYLASVPVSLVLAAAGMAFAYFLVLPALFEYFLYYTEGSANIAFALSDTFNLIITLMAFQAIVFQIPLFIMLAIMMGITTRQWLQDRRLLFWGAFMGISFLFSPDPTGVAPFIVAASMIGLFEGTLLLLKWTRETSPVPTVEELGNSRPKVYVLAGLVGYALGPWPIPTGYYGELPPAVTDTLATLGLGDATSLLLGAAIVFAFELAAYVNKNYYGSLRVWDAVQAVRVPVWLGAIVVGYLGTPDPRAVEVVERVSLTQVEAGGLALGLVAAFEVGLLVARWRGGSDGDGGDA